VHVEEHDLRPMRVEQLDRLAAVARLGDDVELGPQPREVGAQALAQQRLVVGAERQGAGVRLWVEDSGVGMAEDAQPGMGLANLRQRLQAVYGPAAELRLTERPPPGVRAELILPVA
jgi:hypothetical protein